MKEKIYILLIPLFLNLMSFSQVPFSTILENAKKNLYNKKFIVTKENHEYYKRIDFQTLEPKELIDSIKDETDYFIVFKDQTDNIYRITNVFPQTNIVYDIRENKNFRFYFVTENEGNESYCYDSLLIAEKVRMYPNQGGFVLYCKNTKKMFYIISISAGSFFNINNIKSIFMLNSQLYPTKHAAFKDGKLMFLSDVKKNSLGRVFESVYNKIPEFSLTDCSFIELVNIFAESNFKGDFSTLYPNISLLFLDAPWWLSTYQSYYSTLNFMIYNNKLYFSIDNHKVFLLDDTIYSNYIDYQFH